MNRLKLIFNLILGKDIVIFDSWHKEVLMIIGSDEEILTKRYDYDFIGKNDKYLVGNEKTGKVYLESKDE
jgi:hypothetical protein